MAKTVEEMQQFAALMRREKSTKAEREARHLLKRNFNEKGVGFKNQLVLGYYIPDFVIPSKMLIVEFDGSVHVGREEYDQLRDSFYQKCGLTTLRLPNGEACRILEHIAQFPFKEHWTILWDVAQKVANKAKKTGKCPTKLIKNYRLTPPEQGNRMPVKKELPKKKEVSWASIQRKLAITKKGKRRVIGTSLPVQNSPVLARRKAAGEELCPFNR